MQLQREIVDRFSQVSSMARTDTLDLVRNSLEDLVAEQIQCRPSRYEWPADLDPIPVLIESREWHFMEEVTQQCALVLNRFLAEFYSGKESLPEEVFPCDLLAQEPGFLPYMFGNRSFGGTFATLFSVTFSRTDTGELVIVGFDTSSSVDFVRMRFVREALSGCEQLQDRLECVTPVSEVRNIARNFLRGAGNGNEAERNVSVLELLGKGKRSVEARILADDIGAEFVNAANSRPNGNKLEMMSDHGSTAIDVLVRPGISDAELDPLNFNWPHFPGGIPGLLDFMTGGMISIVNAPGSRLAESAMILPRIARLGEHYGIFPKSPAGGDAWGTSETSATRLPVVGRDGCLEASDLRIKVFAFVNGEDIAIPKGGIASARTLGDCPRQVEKDVWVLKH